MKKSGVIRYPTFIEISYRKFLLTLLSSLHKEVSAVLIDNPNFKASYRLHIRQDDVLDDIERTIENLKLSFLGKFVTLLPQLVTKATEINSFNLRTLANVLPSLFSSKVKILSPKSQDLMRLWTLENSRLIKSINLKFLDDVALDVYEAVKSGISPSSLARNIAESYSVSQARAKLIAVDQVAKLNGSLTRQRKLDLGLNKYIWVSARDERVRHSHKVLDGKVCDFNNDAVFKNALDDHKWSKRASISGDDNHPGFAIRCRCTSISIYD